MTLGDWAVNRRGARQAEEEVPLSQGRRVGSLRRGGRPKLSVAGALSLACLSLLSPATNVRGAGDASFAETIDAVQPKIVKIYGAGGVLQLEHYQSGLLISPEGHVLTVWSYVLDTDDLAAVLRDGRRFQASVLGFDPRLEIAVLKIEAGDLPCFPVKDAVELQLGDRVLAFSNLFGVATGNEDASVLHGHVAAKTALAARRGVFETPYRGSVYVLDAVTNNPGSAGGALTDRRGSLAGLLGKELRSVQDNTWLNYAIPAAEISRAVEDILAGKTRPRTSDEAANKPREPVTTSLLGIRLVPDVLAKTPPFVDRVAPGSPADKAGLRPDDLVLFVNDRPISSIKGLTEELSYIDRIDEVRVMVQRGEELHSVSLFVSGR